jgi:hypothetical protein
VKYSSDVPCSSTAWDEIRSRSFEQQRYRASGLNLTGDYLWRSSAKIGAGKFRPFRLLPPA